MNYKEPLLVLVSQAVAVIVHSLAKYLETTGSVNTLQILQIRMLITLGINSIYLWVRGSTEVWFDTNGIRLLLALRTLGGVCGAAGFYYSLQYLPLADATVLNLLAPLGAGLALSKQFNMIQIGCVVTCFLGVGIIAKPRFILDLISVNDAAAQRVVSPEDLRKGNLTQLGFASALAGVLGGVCSYTSISKIGERAHPLVITNCFAIGILVTTTVCFTIIPGADFKFDLSLLEWVILCLIGLCGALMEYLLTAGLSAGVTSYAVHMIYVQVIFALLADGLVWHIVPDVTSLVGSVLLVLALFVLQTRGFQEKIPSNMESMSFDLSVEV